MHENQAKCERDGKKEEEEEEEDNEKLPTCRNNQQTNRPTSQPTCTSPLLNARQTFWSGDHALPPDGSLVISLSSASPTIMTCCDASASCCAPGGDGSHPTTNDHCTDEFPPGPTLTDVDAIAPRQCGWLVRFARRLHSEMCTLLPRAIQ